VTTRNVSEAIDLAYEWLSEYAPRWRESDQAAYYGAITWEELLVCSDVPRGSAIERDGVYLVHDDEAQLVPIMSGGGPGRHNIYDDEKGERLIARARDGDPVAQKLIFLIAARFVEGGCAMPRRLRAYMAELLYSQARGIPQGRRGQKPYAKFTRNFDVACIILEVVKLGFHPTRNRATQESESACSVVAKALVKLGVHMSDSAVEKVWAQFSEVLSEELAES
jgi:hypothetical protein